MGFGFLDGVKLVKGFLENLWDQFYPRLDPEDNNDPTIRINILKGFDGDSSSSDLYKFKLRLREVPLLTNSKRVGRFSYRDIQIARGEIQPAVPKEGQTGSPPDPGMIAAAFEDTATAELQATCLGAGRNRNVLEGINGALAAKIGAGVGPDFTGIVRLVTQITQAMDEPLAKRGVAAAAPEGVRDSLAEGSGPTGVAISGQIASRQDVIRVLDKICEYYARYEPNSPVPIFMQRAKRLVDMNFVDLIKDLAPEAMPKIDIFTGTTAPPPA